MIERRESLGRSTAHEVALDCLTAGIEAADPARLTRETVSVSGATLTVGETTSSLDGFDEIIVLGGGKAAGVIAAELEAILGDRLTGGCVVTNTTVDTEGVEVLPGDHPVPGEASVDSTHQLLAAAAAAGDRTLVVGVITGGGSALLTAPADGLQLQDLQSTTQSLLDCGATIEEINAVRKHLSAIKGGRLAATVAPAQVHCLVLSDVVGNDLETIASGPVVPDSSTYQIAQQVIDRYDCQVPPAVQRRLEAGRAGTLEETPDAESPVFDRISTTLLGDNMVAVQAAAEQAEAAGFEPLVLSSRIRGESRAAAATQVAIAEEIRSTGEPVSPPAAIISGGETTVTVYGDGTGGPNQEFVVAAGLELGEPGVVVAAVDTDGIDGGTDAAGGIVDSETIPVEQARKALAENDAYTALERVSALIRTGPTGTNVNDLRAVVVPESDA
jgi:hydroxypyruvate reductase